MIDLIKKDLRRSRNLEYNTKKLSSVLSGNNPDTSSPSGLVSSL